MLALSPFLYQQSSFLHQRFWQNFKFLQVSNFCITTPELIRRAVQNRHINRRIKHISLFRNPPENEQTDKQTDKQSPTTRKFNVPWLAVVCPGGRAMERRRGVTVGPFELSPPILHSSVEKKKLFSDWLGRSTDHILEQDTSQMLPHCTENGLTTRIGQGFWHKNTHLGHKDSAAVI